jgi:integrase
MYWVAKQKRWLKEYRGKTYSVSCKQLGCPSTKETSRRAANDWWTTKQDEIDKELGQAKRHPANIVAHYQRAIENYRLFSKWHRKYGDPIKAEKAETVIEWLHDALATDNPPFPLMPHQLDPTILPDEGELGKTLPLDALFRKQIEWKERYAQIRREEAEEKSVPRENTIRAHIDDYLALCKTQYKLGTYDTLRSRLNTFRRWIDPYIPITELNESTWERYCVHLAKQVAESKMSPETMAGNQRVARQFIRNRWERRFVDLPRNLTSRTLAAKIPLKQVVVFTATEIRDLLNSTNERNRLLFLLMLNCGFYGVDIAALRQDEVDWQTGRITRQRSKTRNRSPNVPKVDYLLWRETFTLLRRYQANHPKLALLNEDGKPLWSEIEKRGKFSRINNLRAVYTRWQAQNEANWQIEGWNFGMPTRKPLKALRKTSASLLEAHPEYGRYAEYFLGHSPSSVATKHYIQPSKEQFDNAIRWLGKQLGID